MSFLEPWNLLDRKYCFQSNRPFGDLMTYVTHRIVRSIEDFVGSQLLSLNIAKAFD